jgi:hypothetical protein
MVCVELRDPIAGVLARSFRRADCQRFLQDCITQKEEEAANLRGFDPFAVAAITAETDRLRTLLGLLEGATAYDDDDDDGDDVSM